MTSKLAIGTLVPQGPKWSNSRAYEQHLTAKIQPAKKIRLVIVHDGTAFWHRVACWCRAQKSYEVVGEATTAKDAVVLSIIHKPAVVLMGVQREDESSLCATYQIVRTCPAVKVVALGTGSDSAHVRGMLLAGAAAYVLKRSGSPTIASAIRSVLADHRFLDPAMTEGPARQFDLRFRTGEAFLRLRSQEMDILKCILWGYPNAAIAAELCTDTANVNAGRVSLCEKVGSASSAQDLPQTTARKVKKRDISGKRGCIAA